MRAQCVGAEGGPGGSRAAFGGARGLRANIRLPGERGGPGGPPGRGPGGPPATVPGLPEAKAE